MPRLAVRDIATVWTKTVRSSTISRRRVTALLRTTRSGAMKPPTPRTSASHSGMARGMATVVWSTPPAMPKHAGEQERQGHADEPLASFSATCRSGVCPTTARSSGLTSPPSTRRPSAPERRSSAPASGVPARIRAEGWAIRRVASGGGSGRRRSRAMPSARLARAGMAPRSSSQRPMPSPSAGRSHGIIAGSPGARAAGGGTGSAPPGPWPRSRGP